MQVAQDTMGYGAGRKKTEPVRLWDRIMKVKDDDIPASFALIVDAMRPKPSGQNLDEATQAAQRGEAVRPESWTEYETGLPDWGNDAQQYVNRNVEAIKERDGVWQEPDAYDNYTKAQNAAAFDLTMRQLWLMDFYDSQRDVYGDETVDSILSALKSDGKRLNAVAKMLEEEKQFRGKFLDQEEFDTYQRLSKASPEDLKQWNEELGEKLDSLNGQLRGHTKFDLLYDTSLTPDDIQAYNDAQELWDARDRTQQTRNQVLRRYYQMDNESKLAQLEQDPEAKALYETAGQDTTDRKTRKEAVRALEEMGFDYKRLSRYQQTQEDKERYETQQEELKKEAREHPVIGSFVRTLVKPFETLNYLDMAVRSLTQGSPDDIENYEPLNVYNMGAVNFVSGVQDGVSEKLAEDFPNFNVLDMNVPAFLYNTGMSMIDSFAGAKLLGRGVLPLMGGSAAANEMQDIIARGGNNQQVLLGGTAAGAAEVLFEKYSIDRILEPKTVTGFLSMLENAGIHMGVEASEEGLTKTANILSDAVIMCRDSRSALAAREYMLDGKSEEEAWQQVFLDNVIQVAWASAGGGLAGGIMGGFTGALDWAQNSRQGGRLNGLGEDVAPAVIREGLDSPEGSQSYELASKLQDKLSRGKTPSNAEVGALYRANVAQINSENGAGPAEDTDGAAELERGTGRPGIRPTWDTDALLWQTAMEMNRDADPLARTAMEMTQTGDAAPVDTGIEAGYNGAEGGDSYGQTDGFKETAGYNRRGAVGDGLYTDTGTSGADTAGSGRIAAWAEGAQVQEPGEPAKQAVKTVRGYGVRAVVVQDAAIKARKPKALAVTEGGVVYLSDALAADDAKTVGHHEAVHAVKQRGSASYESFLENTGGELDLRSERARDVIDLVTKSRFQEQDFMDLTPEQQSIVKDSGSQGKDFMDLTPKQQRTVLDELNALVWGCYKADAQNARAQFQDVFTDYDGYIRALNDIMEAEKAGVREQQAFPAPLVQLAQEMAAEDGAQRQESPRPFGPPPFNKGGKGQAAPLMQLAQEMAGSSIALERTAMERVQLVQAQVAETFGPRARAFGWNGQVALLEAWNRQRGTQQHKRNFYDGFAVYYRAGLTGESMDQVSIRYTWMLTEPQKQTAYRAGRQDAAEFAARGRVTEGLEENSEEGLYPRQEQGSPTESDGQDKEGLTSKQTDSILDTGERATPLKIKQVKQTMTAQVDALPEEHRQALRSYTGSAAFRINSAIRSGKITPQIQREIDLLDAALKDGVMPETVVLHRDTVFSFLGLGLSSQPTAEELSLLVGRDIANRIFTSTSFEGVVLPGRNAEIWLTVPAGYRGCQYVKSVASPKYAYQEEVLFARGLRYRITDARIENGKYVMFAEVLV